MAVARQRQHHPPSVSVPVQAVEKMKLSLSNYLQVALSKVDLSEVQQLAHFARRSLRTCVCYLGSHQPPY